MPPVSWQALPGLSPRCGALAWWREPQPLPARPPSLHPLPLHHSLGLIAPALTASTCRLPILHQQPSPLSPAAPPSLPHRVPGVNLRRCLPVLLPPGPPVFFSDCTSCSRHSPANMSFCLCSPSQGKGLLAEATNCPAVTRVTPSASPSPSIAQSCCFHLPRISQLCLSHSPLTTKAQDTHVVWFCFGCFFFWFCL